MKTSMRFVVTLSAAMAAASALAKDQDWISVKEVKSKLGAAGYSSVTKINADDGYWESKNIKDNQKHEFRVDPHTGAITKDKVHDND